MTNINNKTGSDFLGLQHHTMHIPPEWNSLPAKACRLFHSGGIFISIITKRSALTKLAYALPLTVLTHIIKCQRYSIFPTPSRGLCFLISIPPARPSDSLYPYTAKSRDVYMTLTRPVQLPPQEAPFQTKYDLLR